MSVKRTLEELVIARSTFYKWYNDYLLNGYDRLEDRSSQPSDFINIETEDYFTDITKIKKLVKWIPKTDLRNGIEKTVEFYKRNKEKLCERLL